jgi:hypothetical protein
MEAISQNLPGGAEENIKPLVRIAEALADVRIDHTPH